MFDMKILINLRKFVYNLIKIIFKELNLNSFYKIKFLSYRKKKFRIWIQFWIEL